MGGAKGDNAAIARYITGMQRSLSAITHCQWYRGPVEREPGVWYLATEPSWLELKTQKGGRVYLRAAQNFKVEHHTGLQLARDLFTGSKVTVVGYAYDVGFTDRSEPLVAWHWHPATKERTHVHVHATDEVVGQLGGWHLPTSRIYFEDIVEHLVEDLDVVPLSADWRETLAEVKAGVELAALWRGDRPRP